MNVVLGQIFRVLITLRIENNSSNDRCNTNEKVDFDQFINASPSAFIITSANDWKESCMVEMKKANNESVHASNNFNSEKKPLDLPKEFCKEQRCLCANIEDL